VRYLSVFCLLAALGAGLSCGRRATRGVILDSAFERFIPPDTNVLAGVQIAKLTSAPIYVSHKDQLDVARFDAFSERTGLDPSRDLSEVLVAWNGKQAIAMAHGKFTESNMRSKLVSLGLGRTRYSKYTLFGDDKNSLVFIHDGLALAGSSQALRGLIDRQKAGQTGVPANLHQRLETIPKSDQIWVVSTGGLPVMGVPMRSEIGSALSNIVGYVSSTATGIGIDTGIHLQADLTCISNQGAQRVRDALRGGLGLARLTTKDNQMDLLRLYDSIQVDQENSAVHVRANVAPDLANELFSYLPKLRNGASQIFGGTPR
jgi:hypothetical protein